MSGNTGRTISDWVEKAKGTKVDLSCFKETKREDMARLRNSGLPQFDSFDLPYLEFRVDNSELMGFLKKYKKVTIRALPNEQGQLRGFTRKYQTGYPSDFRSCMGFLESVVKENVSDYNVGLTSWERNKYGFVFISGERFVFGELGRKLDDLSHGLEIPIASFVIDQASVGHLEDKITWTKGQSLSLLKALSYIKEPFDNFNPRFLRGYFKGVITKSSVKFLDYKTSPSYLV